MTEVTTSSRNDLADVDELYRRLSALDPGRPGEWVRRKVQAYAAQQTAERAVRESTKVVDKPGPVPSAPKVAQKATAAAQPAAKKPLGVPVILGGIGLVVLGIFIVVPRIMTTHDASKAVPPPPVPLAPPVETTPRMAQAPTPISSEPATEPPPPAPQSSESETAATPTPEPQLPAATSPANAATSHTSAPPPASVASAKANTAPRARPQPKAPVVARQRAPVAASRAAIASNARPQGLPAIAPVNNSAPAISPAAPTPAPAAPATSTRVASAAPASASAMSSPAPQPMPAAASASATPSDEFYQAAQSGDLKGLQTGFAGNIDVNARDPKGRTALILAIQHGQLDAVKALLAHGANASLPDAHGTTPMGAAHDRGNFEITRVVERATRH
jgi:hypothetical protein